MRDALRRWRERPVAALVGAALVLLGAGCFVVATGIDTTPDVGLPSADQPVNASARDPGDISANNSPSVSRNPARPENLAVSSRIDTPRFSCALNVSFDGGTSWSESAIPMPRGEDPKCFAPDVAFAADGTLYVSYVTLRGEGNTPHAGWLVKSADGGRTLSKPRRVLGELAFQVRLATDPRDARRLYLTWLDAADVGLYRFERPGNPIRAARSDDGGATWTPPVRVSDAARQRVLAPSPAIGPKGELYVLYVDVGDDRLDYDGAHEGRGGPPDPGPFTLVLARSVDRGATWRESVVDDGIRPTERFLAFLPPFPSVAVGGDGRIYAAYQDARLGTADVMLWTLAPGGTEWRGPTRVNDTVERDETSQYLPRLGVAPSGRVDVLYYDRRGDPADVRNEVSLQSSFDDGETFGERVRLSSRPFSSRIGFGSERELPDLGSRLAILSDHRSAIAFWTDTRAGTVASNKQDIASATVSFSTPAEAAEPARYALGLGGPLLALAGLALLVATAYGLRGGLKARR